jgi:hypothetical protein
LKITVHRAARRKVLRQMPPLAASFQRIQQTVHHLPEVRRALAPATLARRDQRFDHRPLLVAKVTRITQPVTPIPLPALRSPQGAPPLFEHPLESQQIHPIQQVCGRALTAKGRCRPPSLRVKPFRKCGSREKGVPRATGKIQTKLKCFNS